MKARKEWTMPKWMEEYRGLFANTGGNSIEDLVNGDDDPRINLPLSTIQFGVKSQVALLGNIHRRKGGKR